MHFKLCEISENFDQKFRKFQLNQKIRLASKIQKIPLKCQQ